MHPLRHPSLITSRRVYVGGICSFPYFIFTLRFYSTMWCFAFLSSKGGLWQYILAFKDFTRLWLLAFLVDFNFIKDLKNLSRKSNLLYMQTRNFVHNKMTSTNIAHASSYCFLGNSNTIKHKMLLENISAER